MIRVNFGGLVVRRSRHTIGLALGWAIFVMAAVMTGTRADAQTEKVLYSFDDLGKGGYLPQSGLVLDPSGNLYGTTTFGGDLTLCGGSGCGTVFELTKGGGTWTMTVLHSFGGGTDGAEPYAGLAFGASGNLYGTTEYGGSGTCSIGSAAGCGTVFELSPKAGGGWTEKILHSFNDNGTDGYDPAGGVTLDATGDLYGTTIYGGAGGFGTVFKLSPTAEGNWTEAILHGFTGGNDGRAPTASLIFDASGDLYGTTYGGGSYQWGTVFELTPAAGGKWKESVLHSFNDNGSDGAGPFAGLIFDASGNLYSSTLYGGSEACSNSDGCGTVFELSPKGSGEWTEKILQSFTTYPYAGVIVDAAGNLYGTTYEGGLGPCGGGGGCGTVFELSPEVGGGWTQRILHSFGVIEGDGAYTFAGLTFDSSGNLYGTTWAGGAHNYGAVFEVSP
jgi:uncharacterized repeat protein (TIGR03803 family)